ncbi:MAG: FAD-linked oxidase C-terminal domain-containing protein [Candidatus Latescibacterota bacterium]
MYKKIDEQTIKQFESIVEGSIVRDPEQMEPYAHDEYALRDIWHSPEIVLRPKSDRQIVEILKLAHSENIPVTPRGSGTGLCGGCVPIHGGIVLSLENMDKIVEIDGKNRVAIVEPGVTLTQFAPEAAAMGLFFSPRPGDESASFGGMVAANAGGSRALRYGVTRGCTMGLDVALPPPFSGVVPMGGKTAKNSSGYSLMHLMVGSEGTLGVITRQTMRLDPLPGITNTLIVPYGSLHDAIATVPAILGGGIKPTALEFVQHDVITVSEKRQGIKSHFYGGEAYLMIEIDAATEEESDRAAEIIAGICEEHNCVDILLATKQQEEEIWAFRGALYEAIKEHVIEILDIVVPPAEIARHVDTVQKISEKYGVWIPSYGHAGDGNVHSHLMKVQFKDGEMVELEEQEWREKHVRMRDEIHEDAKSRGGLVSGEHGIGLMKKKYLPMFCDPIRIQLMRGIKKEFDSKYILNPGKIFDQA